MPTDTFGKRLREALSNWGAQSHHAFSRRLEELGIKGASYRSVVNYLGDRTSPSKLWIRNAAEILGVSESWLAGGEGQMLPSNVVKDREDQSVQACSRALNGLKASLATTSHVSTIAHLMLAQDQFEAAYGDTEGMKSAKIKESYAKYLLVPLKTLLLHIRGSDRLTNDMGLDIVGSETIRQALTHYLELVLLLMPAKEEAGDEARTAVSACLSQWRKKWEEEAARAEAVGKLLLEANPETEEA